MIGADAECVPGQKGVKRKFRWDSRVARAPSKKERYASCLCTNSMMCEIVCPTAGDAGFLLM